MIFNRNENGEVHGIFQREPSTILVEFINGIVNNYFLPDGKKIPSFSICGCCDGLIEYANKHELYFYKNGQRLMAFNKKQVSLGKEYSMKEYSDDLIDYMLTPQPERYF